MKIKLIDISDAESYPQPRDLTSEEEAAIIAEYVATRTDEALEADYYDIEKQVAAGIDAEELLKELLNDSPTE